MEDIESAKDSYWENKKKTNNLWRMRYVTQKYAATCGKLIAELSMICRLMIVCYIQCTYLIKNIERQQVARMSYMTTAKWTVSSGHCNGRFLLRQRNISLVEDLFFSMPKFLLLRQNNESYWYFLNNLEKGSFDRFIFLFCQILESLVG